MTSSFCLENEKNGGFIQFYLDRVAPSSSDLYRCETFDQAVIIAKHIQRAQQMFHEDIFVYRP